MFDSFRNGAGGLPSRNPGWGKALLVFLFLGLLAMGPALLPGKVLLPYDPRLHRPFSELLSQKEKRALLDQAAPVLGDHLLQVLPFDRFTASQLRKGRIPAWNPEPFCGVPHIAQGTSQVFYPPSWLLALGPPVKISVYLFLAHLLAGALALYGWLFLLGLDRRAALAGGSLWMLSGWAWTNLHHDKIFFAGAWVFLGLWSLEALFRKKGKVLPLLGFFASTALTLLAGFPQVSLLATGLVLLYGLLLAGLLLRREGWRETLARSIPAGLAFLAGVLLALPHLAAMAEQARLSARPALSLPAMRAYAPAPAHLLGFLFPELLAPLRGNPYASLAEMHPTYALLALVHRPPQVLGALNAKETWVYLGIFPLLLAFAALPRWREPRTLFFLALPLLGLATAMGAPGLLEAWSHLPGAGAGDPKRLLYLVALGGVVAAALGTDRILRMGRPGRILLWAGALAGAAGAAALLAALLLPGKDILRFWLERVAPLFADQLKQVAGDRPWWEVIAAHRSALEKDFNVWLTRLSLARFGLAGILAAAALLWARLDRRRVGLTLGLALGLAGALCDLGYTARRISEPVPASSLDLVSQWNRLFPGLPLEEGKPARARVLRLEASPRRGDKPELLTPDLPALLGLEDVQGYVPLTPRRIRDLFAALDPSLDLKGAGVHSLSRPSQLEAPFLEVAGPALLLSDVPLQAKGWIQAGLSPGGTRLYKAAHVFPYALTVPRWKVEPGKGRRLALLSRPGLNPRRTALVESPPPPGIPAGKSPIPARVLLRRPGEGLFEAQGPGLLLVSEGWNPGWRARVDGKEVRPVPADQAFLGIWLPPGRHKVRIRFFPETLARSLEAAVAGILLLAILLAFPILRRRGSRP